MAIGGILAAFIALNIFFCNGALVPKLAPVAAAPVLAAKIEEFDAAPQYTFAYDVQDALTGDSKAQYETRNGDIVQGSYSLIEADGTRRIVDYTADPVNGFNAVVNREPAVVAAAPIIAAVRAAPLVAIQPKLAGYTLPRAVATRLPINYSRATPVVLP
uniref:Larval cuticle protein A2B n=1 Tax=Bracon brevicornis TaxID=1563983 RepID=A0A6V7L063_9HYME